MIRHIVVTWPKSRAFASYMVELERAKGRGLLINYRIARPPADLFTVGALNHRLYRVYDGEVRGWTPIVGARWQPEGRVLDPATGSFMRAGYYIVCRPEWHELHPRVKMPGFRGWRWFDEPVVES